MRRIFINTFVTLDGVMQSPGAPDEDRTGNFEYGGWQAPYFGNKKATDILNKVLFTECELLIGRKTYEIFSGYWPYQKNSPIAEKWNVIKKYVVTNTLKKLDWHNAHLVNGNVVEEIKKLKQQDGPELQVWGSSNLVQTLLNAKLVDELRLWIHPLVIGKGKRIFEEGVMPSAMKQVEYTYFDNGVVTAVYQPLGEIKVGTIPASQEPSDAEM